MQGRPLRFLGAVLVGWVGWRMVALWPVPLLDDLPLLPDLDDNVPLLARAEVLSPPGAGPDRHGPLVKSPSIALRASAHVWQAFRQGVSPALPPMQGAGLPAITQTPDPQAEQRFAGSFPPAGYVRPDRPQSPQRGLAGSAWLLTRGGDSSGPRLADGQAGLVVHHPIYRMIGSYARITAPLSGEGREAAIGLDWRPDGLPVRMVVERRFGLDDQAGGPAIGVISGIGPQPIAHGMSLEAYGQTGVVWRDRTEPFADAMVRITRPLADFGGVEVGLGAGLWMAAQRDAARFDLGPSIDVRIPAGETAGIRLSIDWRERVAGNARPGSGVALSVGADF